jgi:dTDP-4-dehydrorhamnose reductase
MKILVTGSDGQLGRSIRQRSSHFPDFFFDFTDIDQLDITDEAALKLYVKSAKPDVIIHCAAYTSVDKAEDEAEKAFLINVTAVEYLAQLALEYKILLIHVSTDFVFEGKSNTPYSEEDIARPLSIYGKSKLAGETAILNCAPNAIIIRTSWLYSEYGHNFVKTILRLAAERSEIKVVSDQIGTPTYAGDLADAILKILTSNYHPNGVQLFHYSNEGIASWFDFAKEITEIKNLTCTILPVTTSEYLLPAMRPNYSVMSKEKFKQFFTSDIPGWKESLKVCLKNL